MSSSRDTGEFEIDRQLKNKRPMPCQYSGYFKRRTKKQHHCA